MTPLLQKAGGFENVFPVLVIFAVIVSQIIKTARTLSKGGGARAPLPPGPPGPEREPRDELREFLESLAGGRPHPEPEPAPAPRPPPAPVVVRPPSAARPLVKATPRVVPAAVQVPKAGPGRRPVVTSMSAAVKRPKDEFSWDQVGESDEENVPSVRDALLKRLAGRQSLAQAIVLKEILDLPVSLRARS